MASPIVPIQALPPPPAAETPDDLTLGVECPRCGVAHHLHDCGGSFEAAGLPHLGARLCPKCSGACGCMGGPVRCYYATRRERAQAKRGSSEQDVVATTTATGRAAGSAAGRAARPPPTPLARSQPAAVTGESPSAQATRSFGAILPGHVVGRPAAALHASPAASMVSASRGALQALLQARAQAQAQARAQAQHQQQQQQQRESLMGFRVAQQQEVHWRSLLAQLGTLAQHAQRQAAVAAEAAAALHRQQQLLATPQPQLPIAPAAVAAPPGGAAAAALRQQQQLVQLLLDKWR